MLEYNQIRIGRTAMIYALYGLVFGALVPYMARRFGKFMPATMAYALVQLIKPQRKVSRERILHNPRYLDLRAAYRRRSTLFALLGCILSWAVFYKYGTENLGWYLIFIWTALLLLEIDYRWMILPDLLTVPLIILGFGYAVIVSQWAGPGESFIGAVIGYFLPVAASLFLVWRKKEVFGGGDIKYLAAVGAWMGPDKLLYVILTASALFAVYAFIRRRKEGAFGPAIAAAALIWTLI